MMVDSTIFSSTDEHSQRNVNASYIDYGNNHLDERYLLSTSISSVYINSSSVMPGVIIFTTWFLYMVSIAVFKLSPSFRQKCLDKMSCCCSSLQLGGNLSPNNFKLGQSEKESTGESEEVNIVTIIEQDYLTIRGESYDKNRYETLVVQMRFFRRLFLLMGTVFLLLSVPASLTIMYFSSLLSILHSRVDTMGSRMDAVYNTMELLEQKKDNLMSLAQDISTSLSLTSIQDCFQKDSSLLETSRSTLSSIAGLDLDQRDIYQVKESMMDASGISNEMSYNFSCFVSFAWIAIVAITSLDSCIVILMFGTRAARRAKCQSNHNLIYSYMTFPVTVFFSVLLVMSVAVFSFVMIINEDFCGEHLNDSVLDLFVNTGIEDSNIYFFSQHYMGGCVDGEALGESIEEYGNNLLDSIVGMNMLQSLIMSSGDNCEGFSPLSAKIDTFTRNFVDISQRLVSASYIMSCKNVSNWYSDSMRATCADLRAFSLSSFILMFILALIISIMASLSISLRSNINVFLELSSEESRKYKHTRNNDKAMGRLHISYGNQSQLHRKKDHDLVTKEIELSTAKVVDMNPLYLLQKRHLRNQNKAKIERMKEELKNVFSVEDPPAIVSGVITRADKDIEEQRSSRNKPPPPFISLKTENGFLQSFSPLVQQFDSITLPELNGDPSNMYPVKHFDEISDDNFTMDSNQMNPDQTEIAHFFLDNKSTEMFQRGYVQEESTSRPVSSSLSQVRHLNIRESHVSPRKSDFSYFLNNEEGQNSPTTVLGKSEKSAEKSNEEPTEIFFDDQSGVAVSNNMRAQQHIEDEFSSVVGRKSDIRHAYPRASRSPESNSNIDPQSQSPGARQINQIEPSPIRFVKKEIDDNQNKKIIAALREELVQKITDPLNDFIKEEIERQLHHQQEKSEEKKASEMIVREEIEKLLLELNSKNRPSGENQGSKERTDDRPRKQIRDKKVDDTFSLTIDNLDFENDSTVENRYEFNQQDFHRRQDDELKQNEESTISLTIDNTNSHKEVGVTQQQRLNDKQDHDRKEHQYSHPKRRETVGRNHLSNSLHRKQDKSLQGTHSFDESVDATYQSDIHGNKGSLTDKTRIPFGRVKEVTWRDKVKGYDKKLILGRDINSNASPFSTSEDTRSDGQRIHSFMEDGRLSFIESMGQERGFRDSDQYDEDAMMQFEAADTNTSYSKYRNEQIAGEDDVNENRFVNMYSLPHDVELVQDHDNNRFTISHHSEQPAGTFPTNELQGQSEYVSARPQIYEENIGAFQAKLNKMAKQDNLKARQQRKDIYTFDNELRPYQQEETNDFTAQTYPLASMNQYEPQMNIQHMEMSDQPKRLEYTVAQIESMNGQKRSSDVQHINVPMQILGSQETGYGNVPFRTRTATGPSRRRLRSHYHDRNRYIDSGKSKPFKLRVPLSDSYDSYEYTTQSSYYSRPRSRSFSVRSYSTRPRSSFSTRSYSTRAFSENSYSKGSYSSNSYSTRSYSTGSSSENSRSSDSTSYTSYTSSTESAHDPRRQWSRRSASW